MHSIEIVLDDDIDRLVRAQWHELALAGLPSQARHTGESNRPHITLALTNTMTADVERRLADVFACLPLPVALGALLIFGARRFVLARLVVPSAGLIDLQAGVVRSLEKPVTMSPGAIQHRGPVWRCLPDNSRTSGPHDTFAAGRWTPHVTLARRLSADQVGAALTVLGAMPTLTGQLVLARRWDITAKQETWLGHGD